MNFSRAFQRVASVGALGMASLLAACGGGDQVDPFVPSRVLSFGDEASVIEAGSGATDGAKYTVNALVSGGSAYNCQAYPVWNQTLAANYGFAFPECRGTQVNPPSRILARVNATSADIEAQIGDFINGGGAFTNTDLVTVQAGLHDVLAQYQAATTRDEKLAAVTQAATALANQINRIIDAGPRVVYATVPNVGGTPWGRQDQARAELLTDLTQRFNYTLRSVVVNDGRRVALVNAYESVREVQNNPSLAGFSNAVTPLCQSATVTTPSAAATTCTTATLVTGGDPATWLWADSLRLGPAGQGRIGVLAVDRARNHPF